MTHRDTVYAFLSAILIALFTYVQVAISNPAALLATLPALFFAALSQFIIQNSPPDWVYRLASVFQVGAIFFFATSIFLAFG